MPSTISPYLVAMPKKAATHIQKMAPMPPASTAVDTPTMFPLPTQEATAVHRAWKEEIVPSLFASFFCARRGSHSTVRMMYPKCRI